MSAGAPALLGKIPAQGDFVRANAGDPLAQAFHRWLEEAHETLKAAKGTLPDVPTSFLFGTPGGKQVLIGAMRPSADRVGRVFPLCIFAAMDSNTAARMLPALPNAWAGFLQGADALLQTAAATRAADLAAGMQRLVPPDSASLARAESEYQSALRNRTLNDVMRLFDEGPDTPPGLRGGHYYALQTLAAACAPERGREPTRAQVTLDCPAPDPSLWLELIQAVLRWHNAPPSLVWTHAAKSRLLVCLGPTSPSALVYWAKPDSNANKHWPLRTQKPAAIEAATRTFTPAQRRLLDDPSTPLAQLCATLAQ